MNISKKLAFLLATTTLGFQQVSLAAQTVETRGDASVVTYEKDYFERYNAVTLVDMLNIIPGVKEILDEGNQGGPGGGAERGFGSSGDQILLNGRRLAGKSNNISDTLSRISASQIEKIELIRGVATGLDVQSQGLVINITTSADASTSTTFWQVGTRYTVDHIFQPRFLVSHTGSTGNLNYTFSVERDDGGFFFTRDEQDYNASDALTSEQVVKGNMRFLTHKFSTNLSYNFEDGSELRLNGLYEPGSFYGNETWTRTGDALAPTFRDVDNDFDDWEIGGDYTRDAGVLGQLKALFVINQRKEDGRFDRFRGTGSARFQNTDQDSTGNDKEKIFRASFTKGITSDQTLELGGEAAINTSERSFVENSRSLATDPFAITNNDEVDIKENRYEIFGHHTYNISSAVVLQSSLTTEFSKIVADSFLSNGDVVRRDTNFTYLKPRFNLRYDLDNRNQIRATVEKTVSQLDFDNFVTEFNRESNTFNFGNTSIRPEQKWRFSGAFEHRFADDGGSIEVELFYDRYKDYIEKVDFTDYENELGAPIGADAYFALPPSATLRDMTSFTSKSGNIDSAKGYGAIVQGSIRLGFLGVPDAVFSATYQYEKLEITDPFLGDVRSGHRHSEHELTFNFRHDVTDWGLTYGFEGEIKSDFNSFDIRHRWPQKPAAEFLAFAEYTVYNDIKMRLELENITGVRNRQTFLRYNDHIRFGELASRSERHTTNTQEITILLQGTF